MEVLRLWADRMTAVRCRQRRRWLGGMEFKSISSVAAKRAFPSTCDPEMDYTVALFAGK